MAPLPEDRVLELNFVNPFNSLSEVRNRPPMKCYIAIFFCFVTEATHLEEVEHLSTQSFIAALIRFISLRGKASNDLVGQRNQFCLSRK